MALQTSGPISLNDMHVEVGGTSGTTCSLNDPDIRNLISVGDSTNQSFLLYYGQAAETVMTSGGTVNGQPQRLKISASSFISSGETLRIPSNMWVWSDDTSTAALTIDIPCTVVNEGKIIGCGGVGSQGPFAGGGLIANGGAGGPAINVTSSGVTITNSSGAFIAGGGGGGGYYQDRSNPGDDFRGGGGGAGGVKGGNGRNGGGYLHLGTFGGAGGALNASGADGAYTPSGNYASRGQGGGAGGGGGASNNTAGGGGGRILPGTGGGPSSTAGGSAGNPGYSISGFAAGGGGGWGAAGASGGGTTGGYAGGGAGGAAITGTSRTLSNSGTIYGST